MPARAVFNLAVDAWEEKWTDCAMNNTAAGAWSELS
jgi:hypothetical protein